MRIKNEVISQVKKWAKANNNIRVILLTGSRANPNADKDIFSDFDFTLIVKEADEMAKDSEWKKEFGHIITSFNDEINRFGFSTYNRLVLYRDGLKIDFQIWPEVVLHKILKEEKLPDVLDIGYEVILDKDGYTEGLLEPSHKTYNIQKPTEEEYIYKIENFWWNTTYIVKTLWRDELFFAKYMLDSFTRFEHLKSMIDWYIGVEYNWNINTGKLGRHFKKYLTPETWQEVEKTFGDADIEANWEALFSTIELFTKLAKEVGDSLGFEYPEKNEEEMMEYLRKVRNLDNDANNL